MSSERVIPDYPDWTHHLKVADEYHWHTRLGARVYRVVVYPRHFDGVWVASVDQMDTILSFQWDSELWEHLYGETDDDRDQALAEAERIRGRFDAWLLATCIL